MKIINAKVTNPVKATTPIVKAVKNTTKMNRSGNQTGIVINRKRVLIRFFMSMRVDMKMGIGRRFASCRKSLAATT